MRSSFVFARTLDPRVGGEKGAIGASKDSKTRKGCSSVRVELTNVLSAAAKKTFGYMDIAEKPWILKKCLIRIILRLAM